MITPAQPARIEELNGEAFGRGMNEKQTWAPSVAASTWQRQVS